MRLLPEGLRRTGQEDIPQKEFHFPKSASSDLLSLFGESLRGSGRSSSYNWMPQAAERDNLLARSHLRAVSTAQNR